MAKKNPESKRWQHDVLGALGTCKSLLDLLLDSASGPETKEIVRRAKQQLEKATKRISELK